MYYVNKAEDVITEFIIITIAADLFSSVKFAKNKQTKTLP